jgi:hypothetical protein
VLKPVAARLAETSWPARPGFARGAGIAADPEKTPESDEREHSGRRRRGDARVAGRRSALHDRRYHRVTGVAGASPAAFKSDESNDRVKRDRHDERRRSRSMRKRSLRRDVPVPAAKQDLRDAAAHSRDSPEAGRGSGRWPRERRGHSAALRALAFGRVRAPESRSATRLLRTTTRRLLARDHLPRRACIRPNAAALTRFTTRVRRTAPESGFRAQIACRGRAQGRVSAEPFLSGEGGIRTLERG